MCPRSPSQTRAWSPESIRVKRSGRLGDDKLPINCPRQPSHSHVTARRHPLHRRVTPHPLARHVAGAQHDMTTSAPIYPAYTFAKSPTYNVWSKLSCVDIHALRSTPGFEGQNLYFHLNHPIRFVRLVGTVTEIDALGTRLGGVPLFIFLTVDDGSGATVTVKIKRVRTDNDGRARDEVERLGVRIQKSPG